MSCHLKNASGAISHIILLPLKKSKAGLPLGSPAFDESYHVLSQLVRHIDGLADGIFTGWQ